MSRGDARECAETSASLKMKLVEDSSQEIFKQNLTELFLLKHFVDQIRTLVERFDNYNPLNCIIFKFISAIFTRHLLNCFSYQQCCTRNCKMLILGNKKAKSIARTDINTCVKPISVRCRERLAGSFNLRDSKELNVSPSPRWSTDDPFHDKIKLWMDEQITITDGDQGELRFMSGSFNLIILEEFDEKRISFRWNNNSTRSFWIKN